MSIVLRRPRVGHLIHTAVFESIQIKLYLLKTHHILMQQVVKAVDEQDQQSSKEHLHAVTRKR